MKHSYANILAEYEEWVQNVSDIQPMITCKEQQVLMSAYQFETDKSPDAEQTLGDGGDLEEVSALRAVQFFRNTVPKVTYSAKSENNKKKPNIRLRVTKFFLIKLFILK